MKIDLIGQRFGRLIVLRQAGVNKHDRSCLWECICDCGGRAIRRKRDMTRVQVAGCNECASSRANKGAVSHGASAGGKPTRLYQIWQGMRKRCFNKASARYSRYGGRGIIICPEWNSYPPFRSWALENGYLEGLTIDRIDPDGNYEPTNCQWVTLSQNSKNQWTSRAPEFHAAFVSERKTRWYNTTIPKILARARIMEAMLGSA